ncbi:Phosphotransferase enzyme family protein [Marinomonas aquimarina]|uniref:Phosphotransferase enzyme family protein n=1 Tax=Marinomonas aquimarina TaxID=295068 RepID=A0A1A8T737_9GAMM|nr:phosphotransferase [Marinomonas aquimarina]SBS27581.1 Phosphotransferase enzyme family protein [Marinomonas aquimarina]
MSVASPFSAVQEDLTFLLGELVKHGDFAQLFCKTGSPDILIRMRARGGYVQTLREKVELSCAQMLERRKLGTAYYNRVIAVRGFANALSELAAGLTECIDAATLAYEYRPPAASQTLKFIKHLNRSIQLIKFGFYTEVRRTSIKVARRADKLALLFDEVQVHTLKQKHLVSDEELNAAIHGNAHLKRLIKLLTKVAEALIKIDLGHVATLKNYRHLKHVSASLNYELDDLKVKRLALTRSGSAIASLTHEDESGQRVLAVYKEGDQDKIDEEVQGVENWRKINPKLAPDVLMQSENDGETSALLIEHIPGKTLESLLREGKEKPLELALKTLFKTLQKTWQDTLSKEPAQAHFMQQLTKRIKDCMAVHPEYFAPEQRICGVVKPSFSHLVGCVAVQEGRWPAPFSVMIHGDFNVDNLIFDGVEKHIYFIDLHRSSYFDYVQDLTVLMVSIYRMQILEPKQRALMMACAKQVYQFGRRFAKRYQDSTYELRMAAGLARSFASSTRFVLDKKLSSRMHLRARYLLETLAALPAEKEAKFKLPLKELYSE